LESQLAGAFLQGISFHFFKLFHFTSPLHIAMPNEKRNHDANRRILCLLCMRKGDRPINSAQATLVQQHVMPDYDSCRRTILPGSLCASCRIKLQSQASATPQALPPPLPYQQIVEELQKLRPLTRENPVCHCWMCQVASSHASKSVLVKHPFSNDTSAAGSRVARGRPPTCEPTAAGDAAKCCRSCHSPVFPGARHTCSHKSKLENISSSLSPRSKEHIACEVLRNKFGEATEQGAAAVTVTPATGGHGLKVQAAVPGASQGVQLSCSTVVAVKTALNLGNNQTTKAAKIIREETGCRKAVEAGLKDELRMQGRSLERFFRVEEMEFVRKDGTSMVSVQRPVAFCCDLSGLLNHVCSVRDLNPGSVNLKLGIDGGANSIKVCLSVTAPEQPTPTPRRRQSDSQLLDSGVKKLFLLCVVEDVQEQYDNIAVLLHAVDISSIHFTLACDLKLANMISGIQGHASAHPCIYCEGSHPWNAAAPMRTLGSIREKAEAFRSAGSRQQAAKHFANCVRSPLLPGADSDPLLKVVPPPELHIMLGVVNRIFDELNAAWGEDNAYKWGHSVHVCRKLYHGGCLEGPACRRLLQKAHELRRDVPPRLRIYADALKDFDAVRLACFGQDLSPDFEDKITRLELSCRRLQLRTTPKMHVLFHHVPAFCNGVGKGLGSFSEQATESAHADFRQTRERYQRPQGHPQYSEGLLLAVINYNSFHL
jgi:hypothetical protein